MTTPTLLIGCTAATALRIGRGTAREGGMRVAVKRLKKEFDEIERSAGDLPFTVHPLEVGIMTIFPRRLTGVDGDARAARTTFWNGTLP